MSIKLALVDETVAAMRQRPPEYQRSVDIRKGRLGTSMRVLVCGSRKWFDRKPVMDRLRQFDTDTMIIQGGAQGADMQAKHVAFDLGMPMVEVPANWTMYSRTAGPLRNRWMLSLEPDLVIAFDMGGPGTRDMINAARQAGIPVEVHRREHAEAPITVEHPGASPNPATDARANKDNTEDIS